MYFLYSVQLELSGVYTVKNLVVVVKILVSTASTDLKN